MSSEVFFNANSQPTDGSLDKTAIGGDITSATRDFTGQGANGGQCELAGWAVGGSAPNVLPSGVSVELQRQVDPSDSDSWMAIATINNSTSRLVQIIPNGTYRVVTTGYVATSYKVKLAGV